MLHVCTWCYDGHNQLWYSVWQYCSTPAGRQPVICSPAVLGGLEKTMHQQSLLFSGICGLIFQSLPVNILFHGFLCFVCKAVHCPCFWYIVIATPLSNGCPRAAVVVIYKLAIFMQGRAFGPASNDPLYLSDLQACQRVHCRGGISGDWVDIGLKNCTCK